MNNLNKCQVPRCRDESFLIYYTKGVCHSCWEKHCDKKINLLELLKIKTKQEIRLESKPEMKKKIKIEIKKEKEPEVKIWKEKQSFLF